MASWFEFGLLAAFLWAAIALLNKFIVTNRVKDAFFATAVYCIGAFVLVAAAALVLNETAIPPAASSVALLAGMLSGGALLFYFMALQKEEASRVMPVLSLSTIIVLVISFTILGERLSATQYAGALSLVAGAFLISVRRVGHAFRMSGTFLLVSAAAFFDAVRNVMTKAVASQASPLALFFWLSAGLGLFGLLLLAWRAPRLDRLEVRSFAAPLFLLGFAYATAFFSNTLAIVSGPVSLASALTETAAFFVFISATALSVFHPAVFKEEITRPILVQKAVAIALVITGAFLIA